MSRAEENKKKKTDEQTVEYVETLLNVRRVAKVIKGGRRFAFSALVVVGDQKGKIGIALGKGREVSLAISKAFKKARKDMFEVPLYKTTVPFTLIGKHGASRVVIRSASKGTGIIAGGGVRTIMEAVGIKDILAKSIGSPNSSNVVKATIDAFQRLRSAQHLARLRGKTVEELVGGRDNVAAQ